MVTPAIGVALRTALSRQGNALFAVCQGGIPGFRLKSMADEEDGLVTDVTDGIECLLRCAR
jgi:hypothetical protein